MAGIMANKQNQRVFHGGSLQCWFDFDSICWDMHYVWPHEIAENMTSWIELIN